MATKTFATYSEAQVYARTLHASGLRGILLTRTEDGESFRVIHLGDQELTIEAMRDERARPDQTSGGAKNLAPTIGSQINAPTKAGLGANSPSQDDIASRSQQLAACVGCGNEIPEDRRKLLPGVLRCVKCQEEFERTYDTTRKAPEGFGGTREEVRRMKAHDWGEMVSRSK